MWRFVGVLSPSPTSNLVTVGLFVVFVVLFFVQTLHLYSALLVPLLAVLIGLGIGWLAGEALAKAPLSGKVIWGAVTSYIAWILKNSIDTLRANAQHLHDATVVVLGFIPVVAPVVKISLGWGAGAFVFAGVVSLIYHLIK